MTSTRLSSDERRVAIMSVAVPLFATKGFDALTTKEIADAAGVSEALLYRHFESKQALFLAVQDTCVAQAAAEARRLETLPDNTSTLVLAIYVLCAKIQNCLHAAKSENDEVPRLLMRSLLGDGEFARGFLAETSAAWVVKIEKCVKAAIAAGDLDDTFEAACLGGVVRAPPVGGDQLLRPAGARKSRPLPGRRGRHLRQVGDVLPAGHGADG